MLTVLTHMVILVLVVTQAYAEQAILWKPLNNGLQTATFKLTHGNAATRLYLIKINLNFYDLKVVRAQELGLKKATIRQLVRFSGGHAGINASFFDKNGKAIGLLVQRGILIQKIHNGGETLSGIFGIKLQGDRHVPFIIHRSNFSPSGVLEAVQAGPRLISNGLLIKGIKEKGALARRSGICLLSPFNVIMYVTPSDLYSISLSTLQKILYESPIKCRDAINLDGGGSTQMYVAADQTEPAGQHNEIYIRGLNKVPVAIVAVPQ